MKICFAHTAFKYLFEDVLGEGELYNEKITSADLVVFSGGEDISPKLYNETTTYSVGINPLRDSTEWGLLEKIYTGEFKAKRVLGVCRGHQLMSAFCGAKLFQDIFMDQETPHPYGNHHRIKWLINNKLSAIKSVTSVHHQAVIAPLDPDGYKKTPTILAVEPESLHIEAILWGEDWLGVQFHPEFDGLLSAQFFPVITSWVNGERII